jgi:hypothetical protein
VEQDFAKRFEQAWQAPMPDRLVALLREDVVLYQPHLPPLRGKPAVHREFRKLLAWLPGLHSVVKGWQGDDGLLFIEHELRAPMGTSTIRIPAVDRFRLVDGLAAERVVYFDQVRLITAVLRHPRLWTGYLRYRFGSG